MSVQYFGAFRVFRRPLSSADQLLQHFRFGFIVIVLSNQTAVQQRFEFRQFCLWVFGGRLNALRRLGCRLSRGLHHARHRASHCLTDTCAHAQACANSGKSAFVLRGERDGFGGLVLGVTSQVADDAHGNFLIQGFLDGSRQSDAFDCEVFQRQAEFGKFRAEQLANFLRQQTWFAAMSKTECLSCRTPPRVG